MISILLTLAGIVLPSALLAWAVNRWLAPVSARLAALLIVLVLVTLHLAVFTSAMPVALDEVMRGYPYKGLVAEVEARNPQTNDTVKQMLPWMEVAKEELSSGRTPLWNRYSFSGYPLLGNAQSAALSPFFLATFFVSLPKQIVAMAGLKLFVALLFGVLFLREEGAGDAAALAGSMAFAFCIFQNVYLYYPHSSVTSLLPALAWAIVRSLRGGRKRDLTTLALVTAAAFASGHPEMVFHLSLAGAVIVLIELVTGTIESSVRWRRLGLTLAYAMLGALLASAAWFPTVEQILSSQRLDALAAEVVDSQVFPGIALWTSINPDGFGNPARGNWQWIFNYLMVAPTFVGLVPLILLPGALLSKSSDLRTRMYVFAGFVMLLISLRWTLIGEIFNSLPIASSAANDRLRFFVVFLVAVAAARRLGVFMKSKVSAIDVASGLVVISLSIYLYRKLAGVTLVGVHLVVIAGVVLFVIACSAVVIAVGRGESSMAATRLPVLAAIVIGVELFLLNLPFNALTPGSYFAPDLPIVDAIHAAAPDEPYRVLGHDWVLLPNASAHYGLEDVRGSDPMAWGPYTRFFGRVQVEDQVLDVLRVQRVDDSAVDFLNVRFLLTEPKFVPGDEWRRIYSGPDGALFENEQWVRRFFAPAQLLPAANFDARAIDDLRESAVVDDPTVAKPSANPSVRSMWIGPMSPTRFRLTIDATERTFIASSQPAVPGWKVKVNGSRVDLVIVNGAFIGFTVEPGISKVVVGYEPVSWRIGLVMSLLGVVGVWGVGRR